MSDIFYYYIHIIGKYWKTMFLWFFPLFVLHCWEISVFFQQSRDIFYFKIFLTLLLSPSPSQTASWNKIWSKEIITKLKDEKIETNKKYKESKDQFLIFIIIVESIIYFSTKGSRKEKLNILWNMSPKRPTPPPWSSAALLGGKNQLSLCFIFH